MRRLPSGPRAGVLAVGLVVLAATAQWATVTIGSDGCKPWRFVPSPKNGGYFTGVSGTSSQDVWAVGVVGNGNLIEHWDGTAWTEVPHSGATGALEAVAALSATDAWTAGRDNEVPYRTLTEHWDGTIWTVVPSPSPGTFGFLAGLAAISPDDVWAVGGYTTAHRGIQPLLEHWDGILWTRVREPDTSEGGLLFGASAVATDDVWAVGYQGTSQGFESVPLTEHWDGTAWSVVPAPSPSQVGQNVFYSMTAVATDDAWAVGEGGDGPFIEHWDGTAWSLVDGAVTEGTLRGVGAVATDNVWAVGALPEGAAEALVEHWDGNAWTEVSAPAPGTDPLLVGVDPISSSYIWAVGSYDAGGLTEFSRGLCH